MKKTKSIFREKMIVGAQRIRERLEISEGSFMFLIQMNKLPARLNADAVWEISESDLKAYEIARDESAARDRKKKADLKN